MWELMTTRKPPHDPPEPERPCETMAPLESTAIALMEGKIAELESAVAEAKDRYLRTAADFDNFKKRSRQQQLETIQHASANLIARLLPAPDDLHKALAHKPRGADESRANGRAPSVRQLEAALTPHGLAPPRPRGVPFAPQPHEPIQ